MCVFVLSRLWKEVAGLMQSVAKSCACSVLSAAEKKCGAI